MKCARVNPDTQAVEVREFETAPDRKGWLPLVIDPLPTPGPTQVIVDAGISFGATEARQSWTLREKTADEIELEGILAEQAKADEILADMKTQRDITRATWDAYTANQLRAEQWRDRQVLLLRAASLLMRMVKRST